MLILEGLKTSEPLLMLAISVMAFTF